MQRHVRPTVGEYPTGMLVNFAHRHNGVPGTFQTQVHAANTGEQREDVHRNPKALILMYRFSRVLAAIPARMPWIAF